MVISVLSGYVYKKFKIFLSPLQPLVERLFLTSLTFNVISYLLQIISVTVITLVACMLSDKTYLVSIAEEGNNYEAGLYILLCTGILMLIVSVLGWCSAFKHSRYCLATFCSIMLVIVVAQVAFAGWLYAHKDRLDELVRSSVINTVKVIKFPFLL